MSAGPVVVGSPPFQGEALVPHDLDPLDVVAVPQQLEDAVGEAEPQNVLDRLQVQEVVDAEDGVLGERPMQQAVQRLGGGEVLTERFLDDDPAPLRQASPGQGFDGGRKHPRRQGQVGHDGLTDWLQRRGHLARVGHLGTAVLDGRDERVPRLGAEVGGVTFQRLPNVAAKRGGVPVVPRNAEHGESRREFARRVEPGQRRHQLPGSQVAAGAEDDQPLVHAAFLQRETLLTGGSWDLDLGVREMDLLVG